MELQRADVHGMRVASRANVQIDADEHRLARAPLPAQASLSWPKPWWIAAAFLVALGQYVLFSLLGEQRDSGELLVTAQQLLRGRLPYTMAYLVKTPGSAYLIAGWMKVFGENLIAVRLLILILNVLGALGTALLGRVLGLRRGIASLAALLYFCAAPYMEGSQILTEPFLIPFATLAFCSLVRGLRVRRLRGIAVAGGLIAASTWMKQVGVFFLPPALSILCLELYWRRISWSWGLKAAALMIGGFAFTMVLLTATAVRDSNHHAFLQCVLYGLFLRSSRVGLGTLDLLLRRLQELPGIWWPAFVLFAVGMLRFSSKKFSLRSGRAVLFPSVVMLCALLPTLHRSFPHYFLPALPFASLLAGMFWYESACLLVRARDQFLRVALACLLVLATVPLMIQLGGVVRDLKSGATVFNDLRIAKQLRSIIGTRSILVLPTQAHFYFLCRVQPPTPHIYFFEESARPMAANPRAATNDLLRKLLLDALKNERISYVLLFGDWELWDNLPESERAKWVSIASLETWEYDTRQYHRVPLHLLLRTGARQSSILSAATPPPFRRKSARLRLAACAPSWGPISSIRWACPSELEVGQFLLPRVPEEPGTPSNLGPSLGVVRTPGQRVFSVPGRPDHLNPSFRQRESSLSCQSQSRP